MSDFYRCKDGNVLVVGDRVHHNLVKNSGNIIKMPKDHDGDQCLVKWDDGFEIGATPENLTLIMPAFVVGDIVQHKYVINAQEGVINKITENGLNISWYKWVEDDGEIATVGATDIPGVIKLLHGKERIGIEELELERVRDTIEI